MPDYSKIQNERLRRLLMDSESINSRPEAEVQATIDSIAGLDAGKQQEVALLLEQEQKNIDSAKIAAGVTPEKELEAVQDNSRKLTAIKQEFNTTVRQHKENKSHLEDDKSAEELLKSLDT